MDSEIYNVWLKLIDIFLLNVDVKLTPEAVAELCKNVLPEIISRNQNAYVKNRCTSEGVG